MAGMIRFDDSTKWIARSGIFYWVITEIAGEIDDAQLKATLLEIEEANLGFLDYGSCGVAQQKQIKQAAQSLTQKIKTLPISDQGQADVVGERVYELLEMLRKG